MIVCMFVCRGFMLEINVHSYVVAVYEHFAVNCHVFVVLEIT